MIEVKKSIDMDKKYFGEGAEVYDDGNKVLFYQLTWRIRDMFLN